MHTPDDIQALFSRWNKALATGRPEAIIAFYAQDAVLVPTLSNRIRRTPDEIRAYFEWFLAQNPRCTLNELSVRIYADVAISTGVYSFTFDAGDAPQTRVRFTFVYLYRDGVWTIIEHHSSRMPEC